MKDRSNLAFRSIVQDSEIDESGEKASYFGISIKVFICLALTIAAGFGVWRLPLEIFFGVILTSGIVAFISAMIGCRNVKAAGVCAVIYSIAEGALLGAITGLAEAYYPGIGIAAVGATVVVFAVSLVFFATGMVRASQKLIKFVSISLVSILALSVIALLFSIFGNFSFQNLFFGNGTIATILAVFIVIVAAFMLIIDFDDASNVVESGSPKKYEWTCVLGLVISVLYLYYHILRLLIILTSRRD